MKIIENRIPVSGPSITELEVEYVVDAVKNAWYENANEFNKKFEEKFKKYVNRKYAITLPSCTSAIHLALCALGIGPGDEVIVPDITWIATAAPIKYVQATPIFVDIDEKSWCIDAKSIKENITDKTKAIICVDLYGNLPKMNDIYEISQRYGIPIIEDAAQAMGSTYKGKKAGSFGEISVFSFHGSKIMTTGEGGMLVTDNEKIYKRCLKLRDHGRVEGSKMFWNDEVAYKYKMSSLQAALGIAQLERIDELVEYRQWIFSEYNKYLGNEPGIKLNYTLEHIESNYWMVTLIWDKSVKIGKEELIKELEERAIATRPFFYPLSMEPAFKDSRGRVNNKNAYEISEKGINLPSGMNMNKELIQYVSLELIKLLEEYRVDKIKIGENNE